MTTTKPFQLGTVISGTLRPEDLLPAFVHIIDSLGGDSSLPWFTHQEFQNGERSYLDCVMEAHKAVLNQLCPPFVYFGTHPNDPSDFGFWPDWDALQATISDACTQNGAITFLTAGVWEFAHDDSIVQVYGPSNVRLYDLDRNLIWEAK